MASRRTRTARAGAEPEAVFSISAEEPIKDMADSVPAPELTRKPRSRTAKNVGAPPAEEAEKENLVNAAVLVDKVDRKATKGQALELTVAQEEVAAPTEETKAGKKAAKRVPKTKVLNDCQANLEKEVVAVTQGIQDISLAKAKIQEEQTRLDELQAKLNEQAASQKKREAKIEKEEKLLQLQRAEQPENKPSRKVKDPEEPKRATTAFFAFSKERRPSLLEAKLKVTEIAKTLGEEWKKLSDAEKAPYEKIAAEDKLRYSAEHEAYLKKKSEEPELESEEEEPQAQASHNLRKKEKLSMKVKVKINMKDPNKPKMAPNPYNLFRKEHQQRLKEENPSVTFGELSVLVGKMWQEASQEEKQTWADKALPAQEKYKEEMILYKAKQGGAK